MPSFPTFITTVVMLGLFFLASLFLKLKVQSFLKGKNRLQSPIAVEVVSDITFILFFSYCLMIASPHMAYTS